MFLTNAGQDFTFYHGRENPDRALSGKFRRLESHRISTITAKCFAILQSPHRLAICNVNVRLLLAHAVNVTYSHVIHEVPLLCFTEMWIDTVVKLPGYKCVSLAIRQRRRAATVVVYERLDEITLLPHNTPYLFNSLPHMSWGDAWAVKTSQGFVVAVVYISPGTSRNDIINFLRHNFSAMCEEECAGDRHWELPAFLDAELDFISFPTSPSQLHATTAV